MATNQIPDLKVTLANVKYAAFASEETSCFNASVVVNGVVVGTARNDGKGGMTFIEPQTLVDALDEYGALLPELSFGEEYGGGTYKQTAETLVDDALTEHLLLTDMRKVLRKRVLFTVKGKTGVYQTKTLTAQQIQVVMSHPDPKSKLKDCDQILNLLPEDEAFALYKASSK